MAPEYEFVYTDNPKIFSLDGTVEQINRFERSSWQMGLENTSGLVTGCFDILHVSQVEFLRRAKEKVHTLVVGVDRDETVALKGSGRPFFNLKQRCEMLASLDCVDLIFPIPFALRSYEESEKNTALFEDLTNKLFNPDSSLGVMRHYLITNEAADPFWREKANRAKRLPGVIYMGLNVPRQASTTEVANKVQGIL